MWTTVPPTPPADDDTDDQGKRSAEWAGPDTPDPADAGADESVVREQVGELRDFVRRLKGGDIKSGNWFEKLLIHSMHAYATKVDAAYFRVKYPGLPADAIVDARIKLASRYAAIEGGLSASAYNGAVIATLGTAGGASPATLPAAALTVMVDLAFTTGLQLQLAYDIAVLYRVHLDLSDPDDLWKLIRVAFTIKSGELAREGVAKAVPVLVRPLVKAFYRGSVLQAARAFPVVGRYLLQRTVIKVGIPLVGVPLATLLNRYTTLLAGRHARGVFRNEARIREEARRLLTLAQPDEALVWVAWAAATADGRISDEEKLLVRDLVAGVRASTGTLDQTFDELIELDLDEVWQHIGRSSSSPAVLLKIVQRVVVLDGPANKREKAFIAQFVEHFDLPAP